MDVAYGLIDPRIKLGVRVNKMAYITNDMFTRIEVNKNKQKRLRDQVLILCKMHGDA